jgi:CRP-like cAMP-binding protein
MDDKKERSLLNLIKESSKENLMRAGKIVSLKQGEILFSERQEVKSMYIVLDGFMALYRNSRYGEIKVIFICTDGEIVNEVVLQDEKTSICAKALTDTKLLAIHRIDLIKLLENDYDLTKEMYNSLARKTRRLYHQVGNANGTYPVEKRLAAKIWKLARDYGKKTDKGIQICFDTTVTFLANMLGAKRETVSRIISQLKKDGIILHENGILTVLKIDDLREIAQ